MNQCKVEDKLSEIYLRMERQEIELAQLRKENAEWRQSFVLGLIKPEYPKEWPAAGNLAERLKETFYDNSIADIDLAWEAVAEEAIKFLGGSK